MATVELDWGDRTVGEQRTDLTDIIELLATAEDDLTAEIIEEALAPSGKALRTAGAGNNYYLFKLVDITGPVSTGQVFMQITTTNGTREEIAIGPANHITGQESDDTLDCYNHSGRTAGGENMITGTRLIENNAGWGDTSTLADGPTYDASVIEVDNDWLNILIDFNEDGSNVVIKMRTWKGSESEPGTWDTDFTDATLANAAGEVGFCKFNQGGDGRILYVSAGTDGDSAPRPSAATGPSLTNASASADGTDGYIGSVDTDTDTGTLYHVVTTSSTAPTATQIKAGNNDSGTTAAASGSQAISTTGTKNVGQTGVLSASTQYWIHYVHEDGNTDDSNVATSGSFTTDAATTLGWTVNPAIDSVTEDSITVAATPDDDCNVHGVAVPAGDPTPSAQQVVDGQDSTGSVAEAVFTEAATADTEVTGTLSSLTNHPSYDVHVVGDQP